MSRLLETEIDKLKKNLLMLSSQVEERVRNAVKAIDQRDADIALKVIEGDPDIDELEVALEEECLKVFALHQPVAADLRLIVSVLKINNELERIGDLAVNIAERAEFLARQPKIDIPFDFPGMSEKAQVMLRKSLLAFVTMDADLAFMVCKADNEVDRINRDMYGQVERAIGQYPDRVQCLIHMLRVSTHLERVADYATNISEYVIYLVEGEIVRHRAERYQLRSK